MKKLPAAALAVSALTVFATLPAQAASATSGSVNYVCQNGQSTQIHYRFNRQGIPTSAAINLNGRTLTLPYNLDRSNHVDTQFGRTDGHVISAGYLDSSNYRSQGGINVFAPDGLMLYKGCNPGRPSYAPDNRPDRNNRYGNDNTADSRSAKISYTCRIGRGLSVDYRFNRRGAPTLALANLRGRVLRMPVNSRYSDNVDTRFSAAGYSLSTEAIDNRNVHRAAISTLTDANDRILYKDCTPSHYR